MASSAPKLVLRLGKRSRETDDEDHDDGAREDDEDEDDAENGSEEEDDAEEEDDENVRAGEAKLAQYELGRVLGEGAFAVVRHATHRGTRQRLAMKLVRKAGTSTQLVLSELSILTAVGMHRHVVCALDTFELRDEWAIVLELAEGGEIFEHVAANGPYSEHDAALVIRQVGLALSHMHGLGVCHRDLKPENLLRTSAGDVKVADFGVAERFGPSCPPMRELCIVGFQLVLLDACC
jgi:serine/threonine protein kinase